MDPNFNKSPQAKFLYMEYYFKTSLYWSLSKKTLYASLFEEMGTISKDVSVALYHDTSALVIILRYFCMCHYFKVYLYGSVIFNVSIRFIFFYGTLIKVWGIMLVLAKF